MYVVNGGWSEWSPWTDCSLTCDIGQRTRYRLCDSPSPSNGGQNCSFDSSSGLQTVNCKVDDCPSPAPSSWTQWTSWSNCSRTCGTGLASRTRQCIESMFCEGNNTEVNSCFIADCPGQPRFFKLSLSLFAIFTSICYVRNYKKDVEKSYQKSPTSNAAVVSQTT